MRFFSRRGRSKSVDRAAKNKRDRQDQHSYRNNNDKRSANPSTCDNDSIGSELPTLDQFEIAVPSKSFASEHHDEYPLDAREEEDDGADDRSNTDISSITSVSYRAGYYYLRNIKKKTPEKKHSGCLPSCSCVACMPCSCSWLTCCCCSEAKSELAATAATSKPTILAQAQLRDKVRKAQSPGRRSVLPPGHPAHGHPGYPQHYPGGSSRRMNPPATNRRYNMASERNNNVHRRSLIHEDDNGMYPTIKRNHSLFDELSEEEEKKAYGGQRGRHQQHNKKKNKQKPWLRRTGAVGVGYAPQQEYAIREQKSGRSRLRGQRRHAERY